MEEANPSDVDIYDDRLGSLSEQDRVKRVEILGPFIKGMDPAIRAIYEKPDAPRWIPR